MTVTIRPVEDLDRNFLLEVYFAGRESELAGLGWSPEEKRCFLREQFDFQDRHYRTVFEGAAFGIVMIDGMDAGRFIVYRDAGTIQVLDITLLPSFRNRGAGTFLLAGLQDEASCSGRQLGLSVEPSNPALRLYLRLGFVECGEHGIHREFVWCPPAEGLPPGRVS